MSLNIKMSPKQLQLLQLLTDQKNGIISIVTGGSAGGAKTYALCSVSVILCLKYPEYKCIICRKTAAQLRRTTYETMIKFLTDSGFVKDRDYFIKDMQSTILFNNNSRIIFMNLDPSGDPTFSSLGGIETDSFFIDEAGEIAELAYSTAKSRIGRSKATLKYNLMPRIVMSCNPSSNFLRKEFYDNYSKLGGGDFQKWQNGYTYINNEKIVAYNAFLRMSCYDNPFLPKSYIENLKSLPRLQRLRLYEGNWDFMDNDNSICSMEDISKITVEKLPEKQYEEDNHTLYGEVNKKEIFSKYAGCDVSSSGTDNTTLSIIDQNTLIGCYILKIDKNAKSTAIEYWKEARKILERYGFNRENARNIFLEKNGVGEGMLSQAISDGWNVNGVTQTSKTRSENYYHLGLDIQQGNFMIYSKIDNYDELCQELVVHTVEFNNQEPKICPKEKVKEYIGHSPDLADSLAWAYAASKSIKPNVVKSRFRIATI